MNLNLKGIEELVKDKLKIADICRYPINSEKEVETIREYFSNHESIEVKIEYNDPVTLKDFSKKYTAVFSKKKEI